MDGGRKVPLAGKRQLDSPHLDRRTLAALLEASALINGSLELDEVLGRIAESAAEVLDAEASSVLLLDARGDQLVFAAAVGPHSARLRGRAFDAKLGIAGRVVATRRGEIVHDVRRHPDFFEGFDDPASFQTRSILAAPLEYRGEVLGVVEVLNKRSGQPFAPAELEVLQIFANLAAAGIRNAQRHAALKRENLGLREASRASDPIVGSSAALREVLRLCERVGPAQATVLILGETGTGKELTARRIHALSPRSEKPFIAVNCAALPESLLESELFGHEPGAFTGATQRRLGRFELADGGTLFLDEIGETSPAVQTRLLRVLQEREFVRVGGSETIRCDVRIIAATNRDLKQAMRQGHFREDLYYRLSVFPIHLPPLRDRREDIPLLVEHFVRQTAAELGLPCPGVSRAAMERLCAYDWPGNIRELRNVMERSVLLAEGGPIGPELLPPEIAGSASEAPGGSGSALESYEKAMIVRALREHGWNQTRAAKSLGISRDNLRYRMRKYGIRKPPS